MAGNFSHDQKFYNVMHRKGYGSSLPPNHNETGMVDDGIGPPPPTPLDAPSNEEYNRKTAEDLEIAAKVSLTLPQPDMNFDRINRMRDSARWQKQQKQRDARVRQVMTEEDGVKKMKNLQHMTPEQQRAAKINGVENNGFEKDGQLMQHSRRADNAVAKKQNGQDQEILKRVSQYTHKTVRVVRLKKTAEALGATVRAEEDGTITIGRIVCGGIVDKSKLLREGDEVMEVNGRSMRGLDVNEASDVISEMNGTLVFVVASQPKQISSKTRRDSSEAVKYLRALFDYDALDDAYLPCKELGLPFRKGDLLRIMSIDDSNWWQAYRDEEDDTHLSLAGLIPSPQFQHQRETIRLTLLKENTRENKKGHRGDRKKKNGEEALSDEKEDEEILTYEEMALYQQPEAKKRPIVLIGPPNVGRHELRQRLLTNDEERFVKPKPHTTRPPGDGEDNGNEYNFVSQSRFESMIADNAFIEYGKFQKILYGTSGAAIRKEIDASKICVINLHAECLRNLVLFNLKPFIVFIGSPPLATLRENMWKEGKQLKENELRDIIEQARVIEQRYSHYFDATIRNNDLDRSYAELLRLINKLDNEPQWVPASWLEDSYALQLHH